MNSFETSTGLPLRAALAQSTLNERIAAMWALISAYGAARRV